MILAIAVIARVGAREVYLQGSGDSLRVPNHINALPDGPFSRQQARIFEQIDGGGKLRRDGLAVAYAWAGWINTALHCECRRNGDRQLTKVTKVTFTK